MKVIGVTGMPGAGKSVVSRVAETIGMKVVRMGDVIRDEALKRNQEIGLVAVRLREEQGEFVVADRCVDKLKEFQNEEALLKNSLKDHDESAAGHKYFKGYLIEGIRSPYEVEIFKNNFPDFKVIAVHSKPKTRFMRLRKRMRSDDSAEVSRFVERDNRELKFGIGEVIANSDYMIVNEGGLKKLKNTIRSILKNEMHSTS